MSDYIGREYSTEGFPKPGDRMRFLGENGYPMQLARALEEFAAGEIVTVEECTVSGWVTWLKFRGHAGAHNSVMFASAD